MKVFAPKYETSSGISGSIEPIKEGMPNNTVFYIMFTFTYFKILYTGADKKYKAKARGAWLCV